jgi:hypothetical protein
MTNLRSDAGADRWGHAGRIFLTLIIRKEESSEVTLLSPDCSIGCDTSSTRRGTDDNYVLLVEAFTRLGFRKLRAERNQL